MICLIFRKKRSCRFVMKNAHVVGCFCKIFCCHGKFLVDRYASLSGGKISHVPVTLNILWRVCNLINWQH